MRRAALIALLSHWRRQPGQFVTFVLGLALATGLWSAVQAINGEARASYDRAATQIGADNRATLTAEDGTIPLSTYVRLRRAGWLVSPVLEGRLRLDGTSVTLIGVDILSYPAMPTEDSDAEIAPLDVLTDPGRLFATADTAATLADAPDLPPVIVTERLPPGTVLTDIGTAETLLDRAGQISRLLVLDNQPMTLPPLAEIAPELTLSSADASADMQRLTDSFHLNLTAFGLLSFAVGLFIVHGTAGLAFEQRRGVVRTLRALGLPVRDLALLMLAEALLLALLAGALGLGLGYLVAAALLPDVAASLRGLYGAPVAGDLVLRPAWFASGLGMAVLGAGVGAAQGVAQVLRQPILTAPGMQTRAVASARSARLLALAGLGLLAGGGLVLVTFDGLVAGFVMLAGLLLGAALLLPACLDLLIGLAGRSARGPVQDWLWADLRAQLPGLSLALMALLLALATNIGVGTMVQSFRSTFTGWLDQRLSSELYVTARSDEEGERIMRWLEPRTDAVLPIRWGETTLDGQPARIYGIADHPTYRENWPVIAGSPDLWDRVAAGQAALVNEQIARRADLWPGASVTLSPGWSLPVAGVYSDYGNPVGQAIVSLPALLDHFPDAPNRDFGIRLAPDRVEALSREIMETFDLPPGALRDNAGIKALSLSVFDKTFVVTGALNVLTLMVAGFAIMTSLLTLWTMRLPQVAPLWALGLTRARLARLELIRSLLLAGLTALLALPLGLALAWTLLAVINVEAFGWRLPMRLFPLDWLRLGALALAAGAAAAIVPARRLNRLPPADLLRVFANER